MSLRTIRLPSAGLIVFILLVGCRPGHVEDIPGKYSAKDEWGESSLILRRDHSMEQEVNTKAGKQKINGKWHFNDGLVTWAPCISVDGPTPVGTIFAACTRELLIVGVSTITISRSFAVQSYFGLKSPQSER